MRYYSPIITPHSVIAALGWTIGLAIILADMAVSAADDLGHLGLLIAGASGVLNVRGALHAKECRDRERDRGMFDLGRESGLRRVE